MDATRRSWPSPSGTGRTGSIPAEIVLSNPRMLKLMQLQGVNYKGAFALEAAVEDRCEAHAQDWTRNAKRVRGDPGQADLRRSVRSRSEDRGSDVPLRAARARFARRVARARIQTQYWGVAQPPSGELAPLNPRRAVEYVRAIAVYDQRPLPSEVFSLSPLTQ